MVGIVLAVGVGGGACGGGKAGGAAASSVEVEAQGVEADSARDGGGAAKGDEVSGDEATTSAGQSESVAGTPYAEPVGVQQPVRRLTDPDEGLTVGGWTELAPGLEVGVFHSEVAHVVGDGTIRVVRIDPGKRELVVRSAVLSQSSWQGADGWAQNEGLLAVINASMFHPGGESVFALRTPEGSHPTAWRDDASAAFLAGPKGEGAAPARLIDTTCAGQDLVATYTTAVQGWRLLGCDRTPIWKRNAKVWSHALIGADGAGNILFIHARTPWNTRVFTEILLDLPLDVRTLMYAEGGPEASLVVSTDGVERVWVGSYETGFTEHDRNRLAWNLPSVVGVK